MHQKPTKTQSRTKTVANNHCIRHLRRKLKHHALFRLYNPYNSIRCSFDLSSI